MLLELQDLSLLLSTLKMTLQVCLSLSYQCIIYQHVLHAAVADGDYDSVSGQIIQFNRGDVTQTHTITINDDDECEEDPNENFFSNLTLGVGAGHITVTRPQAEVIINDTDEYECCEFSITIGN